MSCSSLVKISSRLPIDVSQQSNDDTGLLVYVFFLVKGMAMIVIAKLIVMCMGDISFNGGIWGCCSGMYV